MGMISDEDEILDLVDIHQKVVGSITHAAVYDYANLHGNYLRAASGFIINSRGELWIPKRTAHKKIAPNGLDYSAGEHAQAGESYIQTIVRGFAEELNIVAAEKDFIYLGIAKPMPGQPPYFSANYLYFSNRVPTYNPDDFVSYEWLQPAELVQKLRTGVPAKSSLQESVELVLAYMREHKRHQ